MVKELGDGETNEGLEWRLGLWSDKDMVDYKNGTYKWNTMKMTNKETHPYIHLFHCDICNCSSNRNI